MMSNNDISETGLIQKTIRKVMYYSPVLVF